MTAIDFLKGHGTGNDFVVLPDPSAAVNLGPDMVRLLADRHRGIGGDGVIRIATTGALMDAGVLEQAPDGVAREDWFMDYRNADGSIAEMCGNGVGVHSAAGSFGGLRSSGGPGSLADVSVDMGKPITLGRSFAVLDGVEYQGVGVDMGNPHLACVVPGLTVAGLRDVPVELQPTWDTDFFPNGVNLELVTPLEQAAVHMRVHERGVGETLSCGTGTVAAAVAALANVGENVGTVTVNVPGGHVEVTVSADGSQLRGPSRLVFAASVDPDLVG